MVFERFTVTLPLVYVVALAVLDVGPKPFAALYAETLNKYEVVPVKPDTVVLVLVLVPSANVVQVDPLFELY